MSTVVQPGRRAAVSAWTWCAGLLLLWAALLGMVLTRRGLAEDDAPVLGWVVEHRTGALSSFFQAVSSTALDGAAVLLGAGLVLLVAVRTRSPRPLLTLGAAGTMLGVPETGSGFPSAHTLVFTALAGAVALVVWRATPWGLVRAVAVTAAAAASVAMGTSRVYLGDHWPTDVLAAYALAGVVLTAVAALTRPPGGTKGGEAQGSQADQVVSGGRR